MVCLREIGQLAPRTEPRPQGPVVRLCSAPGLSRPGARPSPSRPRRRPTPPPIAGRPEVTRRAPSGREPSLGAVTIPQEASGIRSVDRAVPPGVSGLPPAFVAQGVGRLRPWTTIVPIRRALLSVSDKRGLVDLARALAARGVHLLASGGTRTALAEAGLDVTEVSAHTGQPEILGGRVKTLHPKLHGGHPRPPRRPRATSKPSEAQGIDPIDLVVVNLYPFEATVARPERHVRGGGREHRHRRPQPGPRRGQEPRPRRRAHRSPDQYPALLDQLRGDRAGRRWPSPLARPGGLRADGPVRPRDRRLPGQGPRAGPRAEVKPFPATLRPPVRAPGRPPLRREPPPAGGVLRRAGHGRAEPGDGPKILHGKELSYNNLLDLDSALRLIRLFARARRDDPQAQQPLRRRRGRIGPSAEAFELAYEGDPVSAFGGIVGLNRPVDLATAERLCVPAGSSRRSSPPASSPTPSKLLTTRPTWKNSVRLLALGAPIGPDSPTASTGSTSGGSRAGCSSRTGTRWRPTRLRDRRLEAPADRRGTRGARVSPGGSARR